MNNLIIAAPPVLGVPAMPSNLWEATSAWAAKTGWFVPAPLPHDRSEEDLVEKLRQFEMFSALGNSTVASSLPTDD